MSGCPGVEDNNLEISVQEAAQAVLEQDYITVLCHQKPDGDTLGSGFGLYYALRSLGKQVRVLCSDGYPEHYRFLFDGYTPEDFAEQFVVAVDVADLALLGNLRPTYENRIDLCIDHHPSNSRFAKQLWLDAKAAAVAEMIGVLLPFLGVKPQENSDVARCLYTGMATDTGCFRFSNTTARSLRLVADFLEAGLNTQPINTAMFESKSRQRVALESYVLSSIEYYYDGRCAVIVVPQALQEEYGIDDAQLDGISAIPRQIEGVWVGVTIREKAENCRISLRTTQEADASAICAVFGGGGHYRASGCTIDGTAEHAKELLLNEIGKLLKS